MIMYLTSAIRNAISGPLKRLLFASLSLILLITCTAEIRGQSRGQPSMRQKVLEIERVERERQLLLKPLPPTKEDNAARLAMVKQNKEDFRNIQNVNNKMMADAFAKEDLDFDSITESLSQIRSKAVRLRSNLALPKAEAENNATEKSPELAVANVKDFRSALLRLDQSLMNFVTNPLFKEAAVVEVSLAKKASQDLEVVIALSDQIQKAGKSLNKKSLTKLQK